MITSCQARGGSDPSARTTPRGERPGRRARTLAAERASADRGMGNRRASAIDRRGSPKSRRTGKGRGASVRGSSQSFGSCDGSPSLLARALPGVGVRADQATEETAESASPCSLAAEGATRSGVGLLAPAALDLPIRRSRELRRLRSTRRGMGLSSRSPPLAFALAARRPLSLRLHYRHLHCHSIPLPRPRKREAPVRRVTRRVAHIVRSPRSARPVPRCYNGQAVG